MKIATKKLLIILISCITAVVLAVGSTAIAVASTHKYKKKAVIILPGLFASGLYDTATGKGVWDPFEDLDLWFTDFTGRSGMPLGIILQLLGKPEVTGELEKLLANNKEGTPDSLFNMMAMNEDGTPVVETVKPVPFESESRLKYGVVNTHTDIYNTLEAKYGAAYDVLVFNYDFRLDNRASGEKLEQFINEKGYDEVILAAHSNGGAVAATYLGRSKENRDKVSLYLSFDAPYYGAFSAIGTLEDVERMISGVTDALEGNVILENVGDTITEIFNNQFKKLLGMWAVYQLLPSYELLCTQQYKHTFTEQIRGMNSTVTESEQIEVQEAMFNIDGEDVIFESQEELWNWYCSRPWAKMSNGELRPPMAQWLEFQDSMMVELEDGTKVHSTSLVNTQYISGLGYNNVTKMYFESDENVEGGLTNLGQYDFTDQGDGTVLLYSATAGTTDASRINILPYADHYDVFQRFNVYSKDLALSLIDRELSSWDKLLINLYNK